LSTKEEEKMSDAYLGEIRMFGGNYAPVGWAVCDGSVVSISQNEALYSLLGTTYGGDGVTTFAVPDLRGRAPMHQAGGYPLGQKGGTESVTLLTNNLASHAHTPMAQSANGTASSPSGTVWAGNSDYACFATQNPSAAFNPGTIGPSGGNQPHENMMPFTTINFIIAVEGIYPSQG
jgi:microcystin-dependent protein